MATKDFSQYLAEARAKQGAVKAASAKPLNLSAFQKKPEQPALDALSWVIDIASRPMRAIQNIPNQVLNEVSKADTQGTNYDVLGGIGNVLTAPARGFFSNNPEDQPYGAQLIEKATDVAGQLNDPQYKNVQDNVNPWVKGIGGFGLDVGLDPLTYIPGGAIVSGTRGAIAGAKAATGAAKFSGAVKGIKVGAEAAAATPYKIGSLEKQMRPVGTDQWLQTEAYKKLFKAGLKNNIPAESLLKFSDGADIRQVVDGINSGIWAKAQKAGKAVDESKYVTPESFLETYKKTEKLLPKAKAYDTRLQAVDASNYILKQQEAAAKLADEAAATADNAVQPTVVQAPKAGASMADSISTSMMDELDARTPAAPSKTITEKLQGISAEGRVSSVLKEALNSKTEATAAGRVKPIDEWVTSSIELAKAEPTLRIPTASGKSLAASRLLDYKKLKDAPVGTLNARDLARKQQITDLVDEAYDNYVTSLGGTTAPKATGLKEWFANPENKVKAAEALGEKALAQAGTLTEPKLQSAVEFLSKVIETPESLMSVETFGRTAEQQFAKNVIDTYTARTIDDTPAIQVQAESRVASPEVAEINAANAAGEDLVSQYWASGLQSEEEANLILSSVKVYLAKMLRDRVGMKFNSPKGAAKSDPEMFKGTANWINQFNGRDQVMLWQDLAKPVYKEIDDYNNFLRAEAARLKDPRIKNGVIAGARRAESADAEIARRYIAARRLLDQELGMSAWMGKGEVRVPMYLDQAIQALQHAAFTGEKKLLNRHLVSMAVFNKNTAVPMSNLDEAIALKLSDLEVSDDVLREVLRQQTGSANILTDKLSDKLTGEFGFFPGKKAPSPATGMKFKAKYEKGRTDPIGWYGIVDPASFEDALVKLINDAVPMFDKVISSNKVAAAARTNAEYLDITAEQWQKITDMVMGPENAAQGYRMMANISESVAEAGAKGRATFDAQANASRDIADLISNDSIHAAQDYVAADRMLNGYKSDAELAQKSAERAWSDKYYAKWADERVKSSNEPLNGVDEAGNIIDEANYYAAVGREAHGLRLGRTRHMLMSMFNKGYGAEDVIYPWAGQEANFSKMIHQYDSGLADIARKYNDPIAQGNKTTVAQKALQDIANNNFDDPLTKAAVDELRPYVDFLFGTDKDRGVTSVWLAEGANLDAFETYVTRAGKLEFPFDKNMLSRMAKAADKPDIAVAMDNWSDWLKNVDNPFDFLQRMNYAALRYTSDKALALSLQTVRGGVSMKPAVGFSKVGKSFQYGANPLLAHLPEDIYVADELLSQINRLEQIMMESSEYFGIFKNFINDKYTPLLANWKFSVTVLRLGHHIRNHFSNKSIQFLDLGPKNFMWSDKAGWQVLMAYKKSNSFDLAKQAESLGLKEMPKPTTVSFTSKAMGDITVEDVNNIIERGGLYEGYKTVEDVMPTDTGKSLLQKLSDIAALRGTKAEELAGNLSETQSWHNRAAHVLQFLRNNADTGMYKTIDELGDAAVAHVRRQQPSNLMLTNKEKQLRLIIPFYGWFRQALPVIAEGILTQPGRFMMIPKASFNLAIGMGVNPYQMYDPFPQDQLFPSFIKDQLLGPVAKINGKYYTVSPGLAPVDILNQFVPDPIRGIAGMATPFLKVPGEVLGGSNWGTGAKINDMSDYWDAQLPGINYLSNMTGTSVTGSIASLLQGQGLDPQYSVSKGNKTPGDQGISVSNWFTGAGLQNISKENYINYAELEKRNAAKLEQERAAGTARSPF